MGYAHIFEAVMLVCFGCAWPLSIYKTYKSRSTGGKSVFFLYVILLGYVNGVIYQYLVSPVVDYVFYIFFINIFLVLTDIILFYRNIYIERKCQK